MELQIRKLVHENNHIIAGVTAIMCILFSFYFHPFSIVGLVLCAAYILFANQTDGFNLLFILLPFAQVFKPSASGTSFFTLLEILFLLKILKDQKKIAIEYFYSIFLFLFYLLLGFVWGTIEFFKIFKFFMNLSLLYFFIMQYDEANLKKHTAAYMLGLLLSSIIGLFKESIPGLMSYYSDLNLQYINGIQLLRFSATFKDPNYYAIAVIVALGMALCIFVRFGFEKKIVLFTIVLAVFGLTTYSKSYVLMLILLFILSLFLIIYRGHFVKMFFACMGVFLFLQSKLYMRIPTVESIMSRFDQISDLSSATTGRTDIWQMYLTYIWNNPRVLLWGDGIGAPYIIGAAHNMYVETLYYVGIFGVILYIILLMYIFSRRTLIERTFVNYFLLLFVLIMYVFLCGFTAFEFSFYMMFCWVVLNTDLTAKKVFYNEEIINANKSI